MIETFYGTWLISVASKDAWFSQRYVVRGSDRSDGSYPAAVGSPLLQVSGAEWTLAFEWNDNAASGWQSSRVIRRNVSFDVDNGLVVLLGVDDNWPDRADNDFDDVVVRCQNIDPHLIPWYPHRRTVDFRLPRGKGHGRDPRSGHGSPNDLPGQTPSHGGAPADLPKCDPHPK
jgi:hypothetical protein